MPSDPYGLHPLGTLIRSAPDFFDDNVGSGGFYFPGINVGSPRNYITVGLFNNDTQGRVLKVYGISVAADGGAGFGFFFASGPFGPFSSACQPLSPVRPGVPGLIFAQQMTGAANRVNDFYTGPFVNIIGSSGFDSNTALSPFPLFIVPANWSLVGTNIVESFNAACYFWYQLANE